MSSSASVLSVCATVHVLASCNRPPPAAGGSLASQSSKLAAPGEASGPPPTGLRACRCRRFARRDSLMSAWEVGSAAPPPAAAAAAAVAAAAAAAAGAAGGASTAAAAAAMPVLLPEVCLRSWGLTAAGRFTPLTSRLGDRPAALAAAWAPEGGLAARHRCSCSLLKERWRGSAANCCSSAASSPGRPPRGTCLGLTSTRAAVAAGLRCRAAGHWAGRAGCGEAAWTTARAAARPPPPPPPPLCSAAALGRVVPSSRRLMFSRMTPMHTGPAEL